MLQQMISVACGGALGAIARFLVYWGYQQLGGKFFPLPTLVVNVLGSFFIGIAYFILVERLQLQPAWRNGLIVGFLGAFTTFSTFSLDAFRVIQNGEPWIALSYMVGSVVLCLLATWLGLVAAQSLLD
ncbi:fluoride efflux transporter CrcB [Endozoicomonas sp. SM1973]|uniref:Fluoride-specific ion channel FluC n=2 Tax=Spartinivicinus TaxID=2768738 RepID=A0A853HVX7_9GAMM|nr:MULTISPECIES: fluoride efflux transporter CrcB [Spartinivicinus]MCX4029003.1 fluoride efflux transporter CrcB [Spartinivicinus marinus]MDE1461585.1 fluoride efflux transporter CrcB [Spartinivicinus sp. A2-2]NYZ65413.1 fluoride efflux transporter CrcB [Spartinivicinus marinus]